MAEKAEILLSARDATGAAFASAKRNLDSLQTGAIGIASRLGAIAAGATAAIAVLDRFDPRSVIDTADQLNKLTQRTGVAVETLSKYQFAAQLADVSNEDLSSSLKKLNLNIAAAARGETDQAAAFKAIGVSVVDAAGKVRSADKVFEDIADRFAGYEDGANKVALANAVGGKSFEQLIPLLNGGRQGLKEAGDELQAFGGVIGSDLAAKAEIFNDNLTKLDVASRSLSVVIASGLIDSLVRYSTEALEAAKNGGVLELALLAISRAANALNGPAAIKEFIFGKALPVNKLTEAQAEVERLSNLIAGLQNNLARDPGNNGLEKRLQGLTTQLKAASAATFKFDGPGGGAGRGSINPALVVGPSAKPDAPRLPGPAGSAGTGALDTREATLRKTLDGRLKTIQNALETEADLFRFADVRLSDQFATGELSIDKFYDAKNRAQLDYLAQQSAGFDREIAALRDYQAKTTKPENRQDAGNKIDDLEAQRARGLRESGQAAQQAESQRQRALEEFQRSLQDLDAQFAELSGDKYGAELIKNAERIDDARQLLAKGGGDDARLQNLQALLGNQASFNKLQDDSARISLAAQTAEEKFLIDATRQGLTRNETEQGLLGLREQSLRSLDDLIARTADLTTVSTDPALLDFYDQLRLARERAFDAKDPGLQRFNDLATQAGNSIAGAFEEAITKGGSLKDIVNSLGNDLTKMVTRDLVTKPLADSITGALKGAFGGGQGGGFEKVLSSLFSGGGGAAGGGFFSSVGSFFSSLFLHGGGVVGQGGTQRPVNPLVFAGATRYHAGGIAGLAPDEVPAILRRREEVLRTDDPRHRDNASRRGAPATQSLVVQVQASPGMSRETAQQQGAQIGRAIRRATARND